jgi:ribonuclease P protein component
VAVYVLACDPEEVLTLPRRYRITRREGFSKILEQKPQTNSWFAVHSESNIIGHARLGMSVSKRVLPASAHRNIAKRLIRECFRHCARHGVARDVVIRLRKPLDIKDISKARVVLGEMLESVLVVK